MFLTCQCRKCKKYGVIDAGDMTINDVKRRFEETDFGHCYFSFHVEAGTMDEYYDVNYDLEFETEKEAREYVRAIELNEIIYNN